MIGELSRTDWETTPPSVGRGGIAGVSIYLCGQDVSDVPPAFEKACMLLGRTQERETGAAIRAAKGLSRAGGRIHEPKMGATKSLFAKF